MNKKVKKKWIAALRSNEFEQGTGKLLSSNNKEKYKFCCLGVLCELYSNETGKGYWDQGNHFCPEKEWDKEGNSLAAESLLPDEVVEWAELNTNDPRVIYNQVNQTLSTCNDSGVSFSVIADLIEEQL